MGLINFWGQKSKLDELQNDLASMKLYVTHVSGCIAEIDACWIGNRDKQKVVNAIFSHLHLVNKSNSNLNTFKQTATFVLVKMNELGSLAGLTPPFVSQICLPGISGDFILNPKIQIDTATLRLVANKIEGERKYLDNTLFVINSTKNVIDTIILNLFGLRNLLSALEKDVSEQKLENQRIVSGIRQICDLYESTEKRLTEQINQIIGLGNIAGSGVGSKYPQYVFSDFIRGYVEPDAFDYAAITVSGWNEPFEKLTGQYEKSIIEKNLAELLMKMNKQPEILKIPDEMKQAIDLFEKTGKWDKVFYDKNKALIDGMGGIGALLKYGNKGLEAVEYLFTDYSSNIETLEMLRGSKMDDPVLNEVVDEMIAKYSDKFNGSLNNIVMSCLEDGTDKGIEKVVEKAAGGGLFSIVSLASDIVTNVSGIDDYAAKLETNAASQIYSYNFRTEYQEIMTKISSGQYSDTDLVNAEKYFDLTKASLIQEYESGMVIANTDEQRAQLSDDLNRLYNLNFNGLSGKSGGGGGW